MFEYKIIDITVFDDRISEIEKKLNELSLNGWELIAVVEDRYFLRKNRDTTI